MQLKEAVSVFCHRHGVANLASCPTTYSWSLALCEEKMKISEKRKNRSALHSLTQPTRFTFVKREGEALASGAEVNFLLKLPLYLLGVKPCTTS